MFAKAKLKTFGLLGTAILAPSLAFGQSVDIQHGTAADLEKDVSAGTRAYIDYVNTVKIPETGKSDQALADDLKIYFNHVVPGTKDTTLGSAGFQALMISLEAKTAANHQNLAYLSAQKIADLAFNISKTAEQKRLATANASTIAKASTP